MKSRYSGCMNLALLGLVASNIVQAVPIKPRPVKRAAASYDYVVVGCGAAGLTVSMRLSENPDISVLCIEAGPFDDYEELIQFPVYIGQQPFGFYDWEVYTAPQTQLDGASREIPMGKGVGGSTLINGMLWNRGFQADFNAWASFGNEGWAWSDMLPYFEKSETYTPQYYYGLETQPVQFHASEHGTSGPIQVSYPDFYWPQSTNWFSAMTDLGIPTLFDINEGLSAGACYIPSDIDATNQTRSDARRRYYDPYAGRSNFNVLAMNQVTQILFSSSTSGGLTATGVEYASGPSGPLQTVTATREVIVAAGGVHSPQLLLLSGIGPSAVLENVGVPVKHNLPGVGANLQDHCMVHINYPYTEAGLETPESFLSDATYNAESEQEYLTSKTGPWTSRPSTAVAFLSLPQITEQTADMIASAESGGYFYPDNYDSTLKAGYQKQFAYVLECLQQSSCPAYESLNNNAGGLDVSLMHPLSRGTIVLNSNNAFDMPSVDPRWLINPFDFDVMIAAMQFNQEILNTAPIQQLQPTYPYISNGAGVEELTAFIKTGLSTEFHYTGTCAMLPLDLGGVIDANMLVYGTKNLRVVDSSTFPLIPAAHLQAVTYGVAEKAADIIKAAQ